VRPFGVVRRCRRFPSFLILACPQRVLGKASKSWSWALGVKGITASRVVLYVVCTDLERPDQTLCGSAAA
jgi:hypothetical protein